MCGRAVGLPVEDLGPRRHVGAVPGLRRQRAGQASALGFRFCSRGRPALTLAVLVACAAHGTTGRSSRSIYRAAPHPAVAPCKLGQMHGIGVTFVVKTLG